MPWPEAVTNLEELKARPALKTLLAKIPQAVNAARLDRDELTIEVGRSWLREACAVLRDDPEARFNFMSDLTCVDLYPAEPRFEVIYHLLSIPNKQRVRLKVRLAGDDASVDSITSVWPAANFFEREVFDLFGVRFAGHPYLRRLLLPEDWQGHPLRKDYPVEGYR
jgi:NADH-quinone oxidoreductase subunit C